MKPVVPIVLIAAQFAWASPLIAQEPASTAADMPAPAVIDRASPQPAQVEALEPASASAGLNVSRPIARRASTAAAAKPAKVAQARRSGKKAAIIAVIAIAVVAVLVVAGKCDTACQNYPAPR